MGMIDALGALAGFIFTLLVFSYVLGDNFFYRLAVYVFAGLAAAYTSIVIVASVLLPLLDSQSGTILLLAALVLVAMLMLKPFPRLTWLSNLSLAFIIAVGSAIALMGAITGTLLPMTIATGSAIRSNLVAGTITVSGVITTLLYFQYLARRREDGTIVRGRLHQLLAAVGQAFIVITLGAIYGAAILTSLTILSERIGFLISGG